MTMGEKIKMWREQAGLPREVVQYLAQGRIPIPVDLLKAIEEDKKYPTDAQIFRLSCILEVPLSYFFIEPAPDRPLPNGYSSFVPPGKTREELLKIYGFLT